MLIPRQTIALGRIAARHVNNAVMSAIHIERVNGGARAIATDGRRAIIFSWDEPDAKDYPPIPGMNSAVVPDFVANVPPRALADTVRGIPNRCPKPILQYVLLDESNRENVRLASTDLENVTRTEAKAEEGDYPPVADAVPRPDQEGNYYDPNSHRELPFTHVRIAVNGKQLAETVATLVDLAAEAVHNTVVLTVPIMPNRPIRLDARDQDRRAVGVVMPVQADFAEYEEPKTRFGRVGPAVPAPNGHAKTEPVAPAVNGLADVQPAAPATNGHSKVQRATTNGHAKVESKTQGPNGHANRVEPKPRATNGHAAKVEPVPVSNGQVATVQPPVKPERRKRRFLFDLF